MSRHIVTTLLLVFSGLMILAPIARAKDGSSREIEKLCPNAKWTSAYQLGSGEEGGVDIRSCDNLSGLWPRQRWEFRNTSSRPLRVTYSSRMFGRSGVGTIYLSIGGRLLESNYSTEPPNVRILKVEALKLLSSAENEAAAAGSEYTGGIAVVKIRSVAKLDNPGATYISGPIADASTITPRSGAEAYTSPAKNREDPWAYHPVRRLQDQQPDVQYRIAPDAQGAPSRVLGSSTPKPSRASGSSVPGMHDVPSFQFLNMQAKPIVKVSWEYNIYEDEGMNRLVKVCRGRKSFGRKRSIKTGEFGMVIGEQWIAGAYSELPRKVIIKRVEYADGSVWEQPDVKK